MLVVLGDGVSLASSYRTRSHLRAAPPTLASFTSYNFKIIKLVLIVIYKKVDRRLMFRAHLADPVLAWHSIPSRSKLPFKIHILLIMTTITIMNIFAKLFTFEIYKLIAFIRWVQNKTINILMLELYPRRLKFLEDVLLWEYYFNTLFSSFRNLLVT